MKFIVAVSALLFAFVNIVESRRRTHTGRVVSKAKQPKTDICNGYSTSQCQISRYCKLDKDDETKCVLKTYEKQTRKIQLADQLANSIGQLAQPAKHKRRRF